MVRHDFSMISFDPVNGIGTLWNEQTDRIGIFSRKVYDNLLSRDRIVPVGIKWDRSSFFKLNPNI